MASITDVLKSTFSPVVSLLTGTTWKKLKEKITGRRYYNLTNEDLEHLRKALAEDYYIICTRRGYALTSYLINFATLVKTGKYGHYHHVFMNMEDGSPETFEGFELIEADSNKGVHYSTFMEAFDCDSVALIRPKNLLKDDWEAIVKECRQMVGTPYDNAFDIDEREKMSCVEQVRNSLKALPDYNERFANFEKAITKAGNLTPQMFYDCPDFEVVWEVRR